MNGNLIVGGNALCLAAYRATTSFDKGGKTSSTDPWVRGSFAAKVSA